MSVDKTNSFFVASCKLCKSSTLSRAKNWHILLPSYSCNRADKSARYRVIAGGADLVTAWVWSHLKSLFAEFRVWCRWEFTWGMVTTLLLIQHEAVAMALSRSQPRRSWQNGYRWIGLKDHSKVSLGLDFPGLVAWHKPGRAGVAVRREESQPSCTGECMLSPSLCWLSDFSQALKLLILFSILRSINLYLKWLKKILYSKAKEFSWR